MDWHRDEIFTFDHSQELIGPAFLSARSTEPPQEVGHEGIWATGEKRAAATAIIENIGSAREVVVVGSFLLSDAGVAGALFAAAERGVRVYVLVAAESKLDKEPRDDSEFDRKTYDEFVKLLREMAGRILVRTAAHFHAKFVLVDPPRGNGFLLTANVTTEALERNEELIVALTPAEVRDLWQIVRHVYWEQSEHELLRTGIVDPVRRLEWVDPPTPSQTIVSTMPRHTALRAALDDMVGRATQSIVLSAFGFEKDHPTVRAIAERARAGLDVTVLARIRPKNLPALSMLAEAGAHVYGLRWIHAKALWSDSGEGMVFSANLEARGLDDGFELGMRLEGQRWEELGRLLNQFRHRGREFKPRGVLGTLNGRVQVYDGKEFRDIEIEPERSISSQSIIAASASQMTVPRPVAPQQAAKLAHRTKIIQRIEAPRLAKGSVEQFIETKQGKEVEKRPHDHAIFKEPSGRRVVVAQSPEAVDEAAKYGAKFGARAVVRAA